MSPVVLALLGASSLVAGVLAVWLIAARPPQVYRLERLLTVAVTFFVIGLVIGLPIAFLWRPARSIHVSASWGWPAFIAVLSLLLGAVGFAVGRALPSAGVRRLTTARTLTGRR